MSEYQFDRISSGTTYKSKTDSHTIYTTINNDEDGNIFEIFVKLDDPDQFEIIQMVGMLTSALFKAGVEPIKIAESLKKVYSPITKHIIPKTSTMCPSIVARVGYILEQHIKNTKSKEKDNE